MLKESPLGMHCNEYPSHGGLIYSWYLMQARRLEDCKQIYGLRQRRGRVDEVEKGGVFVRRLDSRRPGTTPQTYFRRNVERIYAR